MLQLDIDALTKRFLETPLIYMNGDRLVTLPASQRIVDNQPATKPDETEPWVRFSISPGASEQTGNGVSPSFTQLGTARLQIAVPTGTGTRQAGAIRDCFINAFRLWRSPDNKLNVYKTNFTADEASGKYLTVATIFWESTRSPA